MTNDDMHFDDIEQRIKPRLQEEIMLSIPTDVRKSLQAMAAKRNMSEQALLKFYIGQGLRQDISQHFADTVLERTAQVLGKHFTSAKDVEAVIQEIRMGI